MGTRIDWQWPAAAVYLVTCAALAILVYTGRVPAAAMSALIAWLVPAPWSSKPTLPQPFPPPAKDGDT